jgi:CTP:molybdopterin cytidylyltransferase MocA
LSRQEKVPIFLKKVALVIMCAGASARFENEDKFLAPLKLKVNPKLTILDVIFMRLKARLKKS